MLDYVETRRHEGMFHNKPFHSVHVPDVAEVLPSKKDMR